AQSMVLLKNEGVLPLRDAPGLTVTVIGEFARAPRFQGAGSSQVNPTRVDIPLDELAAALPSATLRFAAGYGTGDTAADAGGDPAGTGGEPARARPPDPAGTPAPRARVL